MVIEIWKFMKITNVMKIIGFLPLSIYRDIRYIHTTSYIVLMAPYVAVWVK